MLFMNNQELRIKETIMKELNLRLVQKISVLHENC